MKIFRGNSLPMSIMLHRVLRHVDNGVTGELIRWPSLLDMEFVGGKMRNDYTRQQ